MAWGVVARPRIYGKRGETLGRAQLNFDFSPLPVAGVVARSVSQNILIAQLHADFCGNVGQVVGRGRRKRASSGHLRQLAEQSRTIRFLNRATAIGVVKSNGVDLDVGFLDEIADVQLRVPTMIIAPIGYDEQSFLCVVCSLHLAQAEINSIEEGGHSARGREHQPILQVFHASGERADELCTIVEIHEEEFILRIGGAKELHGGHARFLDLVGHTAAHIEDNPNGNGNILALEADDFLFEVALKNAEIFSLEAGDQAAVGIGHRHGNHRQLDFGLDGLAASSLFMIISGGSGTDGGGLGGGGKGKEGSKYQYTEDAPAQPLPETASLSDADSHCSLGLCPTAALLEILRRFYHSVTSMQEFPRIV